MQHNQKSAYISHQTLREWGSGNETTHIYQEHIRMGD